MNKDKISAQDVIDSLAAKTDITKQQADDFFKALISTIEEALLANDFVKIKNLGAFKLNWIAPRKSVNVQTGEDIEIDGYYKVVFTPEKELKELVNKPFAHLEAVALDYEKPAEKPQEEPNPMASLAEQAGTIKSLLSEIQAMNSEVTENIEAIENEKADVIEEIMEIKEEEKPEIPEKTNNNINVEKEKVMEEKTTNEFYFEPEKKKRTGWWILLAILLFLGIAAAFYFFCMPVQHWVNKNIFGYDTAEYDAIRARAKARMEDEKTADFQQETQSQAQKDFSRAFDNRLNNREIITTVRMNTGNRLAHLSQVHYGSPHFWVYIYEANRDIISDPNVIPIGTRVKVPKLDPVLIDLNNPYSMEAAMQLREKYLK
jgi:nucleoid DNA-binding protein